MLNNYQTKGNQRINYDTLSKKTNQLNDEKA